MFFISLSQRSHLTFSVSETLFYMVQVTYSFKNREYFQMEDSILNQLAESAKNLLFALLEPLEDRMAHEDGKICINLDQHPKIELEGFTTDTRQQIEMTLRGEA